VLVALAIAIPSTACDRARRLHSILIPDTNAERLAPCVRHPLAAVEAVRLQCAAVSRT
jgi:hypothetical protein